MKAHPPPLPLPACLSTYLTSPLLLLLPAYLLTCLSTYVTVYSYRDVIQYDRHGATWIPKVIPNARPDWIPTFIPNLVFNLIPSGIELENGSESK